ncbi:MAG: hypothetical protein ABR534_01605 [Desulfotignum sp.]|nr:hypothetical protein [Desulfobacteraceae bacterium]
MTGVSEILVLILLISGILILPRMLKPPPAGKAGKKMGRLSQKKRSAIVISIVFPVACALVIKPWEGHVLMFGAVGLVPVALGWAFYWILSAPKK